MTPAFVEETARTFDCRVKRTYGSTEAPTVTTSTNDDPFEAARDTDGRAVGEVELRVTDPGTGTAVGTGERGELWVRGPEMFAGYADVQQTNEAIAAGGWFRTGDLATVDAQGWLRIVGRLKEVIIRGGENISASEVEAALEAHPAVRQAVVVGYPDPLMGERVAAYVVTTEPFDLAACRRGLPEGAWPGSRRPSGSNGSTTCPSSARASPTGRACNGAPPELQHEHHHGRDARMGGITFADGPSHRSHRPGGRAGSPGPGLRHLGADHGAQQRRPGRAQRHGRDLRRAPDQSPSS